MRDSEQISAEAARWLDRMNRAAFDSVDGARFDEWMGADARNREAFAEMAAIWDDGGLEQACQAARNDMTATALRNRSLPRIAMPLGRWLRYGASAAAAALVAIVFIPAIPRTHETAPGTGRTVALADGTMVELGGNSAVTVQYWPWQRDIRLNRGEAGFDVAHSRWRPFEVTAGRAQISVLGTAFHIDRLSHERVAVGVSRGKVRLRGTGDSMDLVAGEAGLATESGLMRTMLEPEQNQSGSSWFVMRNAPLGDLVEKLRRFSVRPIEVDVGLARDLHITGRFRVSSTEETLALLQQGYGLDISRSEQAIQIGK